ncbi:hypothetical protein ABF87_04330 [Nitrosomonas sp. JL21]|uniref:hypothetical protein n=1 Tax=Nitrosomonas sp. JL21 TaxID=153949 RepID=UPI00136AC214|nr:hypothetical protein [Nitrosomonas sp.]MXS77200.1 hypothetical protein [Nitrosomonas sp. JL21]
MTRKKAAKQSEVVEGELIPAEPTSRQIKLVTVMDCKREMARVYRDSRQGRIDIQDGTRLVYMLAQVGKLIEVSELEKRIEALEKEQHEST